MISLYIGLLIVFPLCALWGIKKADTSAFDLKSPLFTKDNSNYLRGVAAIMVVFSHFFVRSSWLGYAPNKYVYFIAEQLGGLGVLIFFFVSGYGVYVAYKEKEPSFGFVIKRFKTVYFPYLATEILFLIVNLLLKNEIDFKTYPLRTLVAEDTWFIQVIMIEYILFFITWKLKGKWFFIANFAGNFIVSLVYFLMGKTIGWFNALWLFAFGMLFACLKEKVNSFFKTKIILKTCLMFILFGISGAVFAAFKGAMWANVIKPVSGVFLCVAFIGLYRVVNLSSRVMSELGKRSLYIYIVHLSVWYIIPTDNLTVKFLTTIVITALLVEVLYRSVNFLMSRSNKK